jgi:hypothetical protein
LISEFAPLEEYETGFEKRLSITGEIAELASKKRPLRGAAILQSDDIPP